VRFQALPRCPQPHMIKGMTRHLSAFALTMFVTPALAQTNDAPLILEAGDPVPLAGAGPVDSAMAGDRYLLPFAVRNRTAEPVRVRRIAFRPDPGLEVIDPNVDGIDNDRDGAVDEGDEGFDQFDDLVSAWRIEEAVPTVATGETLERAVVVRLPDNSEAGSTQSLNLTAAGSASEVTLRAEQDLSFALAAPEINVTFDGDVAGQRFVASDTPSLEIKATIPSGRITDLSLILEGSPAIEGYEQPRVVIGEEISCSAPSDPVIETRKLSASFGTCQVEAEAPASERYVALQAKARLGDADPFSDPQVIQARRAIRLAGFATRSGAVLGAPTVVSGALSGPLIGAQLLSTSEEPVDADDDFAATFRLVNRGDDRARGLRLIAADDGLFDCKSFQLGDSKKGVDACEAGLSVRDMRPGSQREIKVSSTLRNDALIEALAAMRLSTRDEKDVVNYLPWAVLTRRAPDPPDLSVDSDSDWEMQDDVLTARIGDAGTVLVSGTLPEGRYPGSVRVLSRVVDAQTGDPIGPASFTVERFAASASGGAKIEKGNGETETQTIDGWSAVTLPLGRITVPVARGPSAAKFSASAILSLRDLPEIQAGRAIEVTAELNLYGDTDIRSDGSAELLIVEPSLDLTMRSPDEDRTINLHDVAPITVLSCNQGNSSAEAIILTASLPDGLLLDDSTEVRVFTVEAERVNDRTFLFSNEVPSSGNAHFDASDNTLRGALASGETLQPNACLALAFTIRRSNAFTPDSSTANIKASVEPYTGRTGGFARVYPGVKTGEMRFDVPPILFGPVSEREVSDVRGVSHVLTLEIPAAAGEHRVDISTSSSTGLEWTILQLDNDGAARPWRSGTPIPAGEILRVQFEANSPGKRPLGWIDTTLVRALAFSDTGTPIAASTRLITRRAEAVGGRITVTKTMALDSDCDGSLSDERIQDALFEPVKDATLGDCVTFRIAFKHSGDKSMERIVVRDQVPAGTELLTDAVTVTRVPEPLQNSAIKTPDGENNDVVWTFEGLFEPGTEGEVSYAVQLKEPQ